MKKSEGEVVRVVVVGDPAADPEVHTGAALPGVEILGHRFRRGRDLDPHLRPDLEERLRQRAVLIQEGGMHRGLQTHRKRQPAGANRLDRLLPLGVRLAAARVVAEDSGRQKSRRGEREAPERAPDEVLRPHDVGHGVSQRGIARRGAGGVEEDEVRVLLGRLDEARPELRLAQDRFEVAREEVAGKIELSGLEARGDRRGRERRAKLDRDRIEPGRGVLPVPRVALEDDP